MLFAVILLLNFLLTNGQLQMNFYAKSCPKAEKIVVDFVENHIHNAPSLAPSFLRMHFHDCFVRGCDGSVLLNSTASEKTSVPNQTLRGFDFIDRVKRLLEAECPATVSCADVLALVARDSVVATGGPWWEVPTGRRDGTVSNVSEVLANIPGPNDNLTTLRAVFGDHGLGLKDLVLLSGAHTIGISHCSSLSTRLYNFTGMGDQDPSMDSEYAANLRTNKCKNQNDTTTALEMDPGSRTTFDMSYYELVMKRKGLFQSDAALTTSPITLTYINQILNASLQSFFGEFAISMEKMGRIGVKTGTDGEIRKHCAFVNT